MESLMHMSVAMDSDKVAGCTEDTAARRAGDGLAASRQLLQDIDDRLVVLSEKISMCNQVLDDLKSLSDMLQGKSLQDVSLSQQK
ncbi:hypothetical protein Q5P01_011516 [Channa striata]|uniref:Uncharacterized protein n=1 Tax=Channa striata TaxID=64152 RepID=A0AA88SQT7_CHASR|nr:hypothetical protein Q5P01_011516 [Channa striata]